MLPQQQMHGFAFPTGLEKASDKALLRRKLLQPLARPPVAPLATEGGYAGEVAALQVERPAMDLPFAAPFAPPNRPATASTDSGRPRTAQSAPALGAVSFPAQLRLRAPGEAPGPLGPFAGPGEALVIPLETQDAVRELVAACSGGRAQVTDGACLTAWSLLAGPAEASNQLLEPLAARRLDRTLAVEPIELVAERQGSMGAGGGDGGPLRYGEGFRLRAAGCDGLYLGHGGDKQGLRWQQAVDEALEAPQGTRFAAHGGELGAALTLGRPLSLRRVLSPAPESDSEDDYEDEESCGSESECEHRKVRFQRPQKVPLEAEEKAAKLPMTGLLPEAARYAEEGLFSRLADQAESAFPVTFLPLFAETEPLS